MPKAKPKRTRDVPLHVYVSQAEHERITRKAHASSLSVSAWIRAALDRAPAFAATLTPKGGR